jgi:multiple sugar transport system substrate-binding protein
MKKRLFPIAYIVFILTVIQVSCQSATNSINTTPTEQTSVAQSDNPALFSTEKVKIHWFIGVGTGRSVAAVSAAREFVQNFNASQEKIELELEVVTSSTHDAIDQLLSKIEAGNPPDVIAPADMGWAGEQLTGRILPLDNTLYDFSDIDSKMLDSWRVDGKLIGFPLGTFPSVIFYNKDLFDAAKLPYPPHKFGEPYADGSPWTIEKMEMIALILTRDVNGKDETAADFDSDRINQWGFHWQWDSTRSMAVMFGAGSVVDASNHAAIPQQWRDAFNWYYEGMWQRHFIPTTAEVNTIMRTDPFNSGKVGMVHTFMWYSPRVVDEINWDIAAVPAYKGTITTRMERNGIFILNTTHYPREAYDVAYAIATNPELLLAWEMLPTFKSIQSSFIEGLLAKHPGVDWQVMLDSIDYADTTYASDIPNYRESYDRLLAFRDLMGSNGNLPLNSEIDKLESDLQVLFNESP